MSTSTESVENFGKCRKNVKKCGKFWINYKNKFKNKLYNYVNKKKVFELTQNF